MDPSRELFNGTPRESFEGGNAPEMAGQTEFTNTHGTPYGVEANNRNWQVPLYWQHHGNEMTGSSPRMEYVASEYESNGGSVSPNSTAAGAGTAGKVDHRGLNHIQNEYGREFSSEAPFYRGVSGYGEMEGLAGQGPGPGTQANIFGSPAQGDLALLPNYMQPDASNQMDTPISKDLYNIPSHSPNGAADLQSTTNATSASFQHHPAHHNPTATSGVARSPGMSEFPVAHTHEYGMRTGSSDLFEEPTPGASMHPSISISTLLSRNEGYDPSTHNVMPEQISPAMAPPLDVSSLPHTILRGVSPSQKQSPIPHTVPNQSRRRYNNSNPQPVNHSAPLLSPEAPSIDSDEILSADEDEQQTMVTRFNYLQHLRNRRDEAVHAEKKRLLDIRSSLHNRFIWRYEARYNKLHALEYSQNHDWAVHQAIREEVAALEAAKVRAEEEQKQRERLELERLEKKKLEKNEKERHLLESTEQKDAAKDNTRTHEDNVNESDEIPISESRQEVPPAESKPKSRSEARTEARARIKAKARAKAATAESAGQEDLAKKEATNDQTPKSSIAEDGESSPETPLTKASKAKKAKSSKATGDSAKAAGEQKSTPKKNTKKRPQRSGQAGEEDSSATKEAADQAEKANTVEGTADGKAATATPNKKKKTVESIQMQIIKDIVRKEIPKVYKIIQQNHYNRSTNARKTSQLASREARRWQFRTIKNNKDMQTKAKRAMRETMVFWKRNEREERDLRKKAERVALDRAKKEEEDRESRRQARKLDFLITQTELYSHFVGKKKVDRENLPSSDAPTASASELNFDSDDEESIHKLAVGNAQEAMLRTREHSRMFDTKPISSSSSTADMNEGEMNFQNPTLMNAVDVGQPKMLMCKLKEYQLKGLNWLANLYEQGINGILADEMGLGKTVQSISVMAYLAETHNIWGPFLIIAPASTLHNWQQEITRFVPKLKCIPYWGSTKDRKILRKFWCRKNMTYDENSPFHVVVTSYQLVVLDAQYFQTVKWQYMILDEAQAIKSSSSSRWKSLLAFKCRNRLLLTGTPIQNTMQELWALLHFIMPTLFDSHNEFSEWFSKDIESHAQSNTQLNEQQLKRLHMILKPFMLRRVKKNVQSELGEKIEKEVYCDLTQRQKILYQALRRQISIEELLEKAVLGGDDTVASIMNLVMQFRKVCNHPDLFEREDVRSPLSLATWSKSVYINREGSFLDVPYNTRNFITLEIPRLMYKEGGILNVPSQRSRAGFKNKYLNNLMNIWNTEYLHNSSASDENSSFSWLRFIGESPSSINHSAHNPLLSLLESSSNNSVSSHRYQTRQAQTLDGDYFNKHKMLLLPDNLTKLKCLGKDANVDSPMYKLTNVIEESDAQLDLILLDSVLVQKATAPPVEIYCPGSRQFMLDQAMFIRDPTWSHYMYQPLKSEEDRIISDPAITVLPPPREPLVPSLGVAKGSYSFVRIPSMSRFIADSGKLSKLDKLLAELKANDHRVLIYFQMTKMIDLMEEYLTYRQHKYLRLDGSSKISQRRDMVTEWQTRPELFVFLLSTRAGGLGINLTAADTVIFYDSDWNPSIDSQAMDRAHRIGQQKQVTVYRFITRGTIEERILFRAKEKEEVQKVVISGGETLPNKQMDLKGNSREMVSWLLEE
ncbi:SNF2 family helicase Ino80 [Schizosaccharomyces cryophilus OY26]|uniref:Chromatin-remodeling ATPase INO80 n=1 Tax=Schizosaccharomyces cryophilus (strain OY26 / ATCC MYA-4695 / CBS 11777 / NBRC 106824 / NRRL Y48691) TaxID=653667 RepID=S9W3M7_SCHCR|nr:SNF2 family helicase Ino80 [Schizosaccharomyces cryophilus OY26]EPY53149.1 SNF2 family helicase Ino80 [Schizosaccharomyces cryophilus OY26]